MTFRAALLGIVVVMAIVMGAPYSIWMVRSSEITWSYFPTSAGFCFVVILLAQLRWCDGCGRRGTLRPAELAIIVIMGLAADRDSDLYRRHLAGDYFIAVLRSYSRK